MSAKLKGSLIAIAALWLGLAVTATAAPRSTAQAAPAAADPVIAAAGDIACDPGSSAFNGGNGTTNSCQQKAVSDLLVGMNPAAVLSLGDNQYYCGSLAAYQQSYDPSWGRVKAITRPVVGNHEYLTAGGTGCTTANAGAAGYFDYFGAAAGQRGQGWYSFDVGAWHLIALNTNCSSAGGCGPSTPQGAWLAADLAAHANLCTLAFWHIPLYSSGGRASKNSKSMYDQLYKAGADFVLTGHDHTYERFAPQDSNAIRDDHAGIREFVIGTGGANHTPFTTVAANSEVRDTTRFGVIQLTLHPDSLTWQFVGTGAGGFTDSGTQTCHGKPSDTTAPTAPTNLTATTSGPGQVSLAWSASTDATGVASYRVQRDGVELGTATASSYVDSTVTPGSPHTYTVTAVDYNNWVSALSTPAVVNVASDSTPPSTPTGLAASNLATSVGLTWLPSTDNGQVSGYRVFRNGAFLASSTTTSLTDASVAPLTSYSYEVSAVDSAGNESPRSTPLPVTTPGLPSTLTLAPIADTYVQADTPTVSYGSATTFVADGSPQRRTLLKFQVAGVNGRTVVSAVLRLWCVDASGTGGAVHAVADTAWTESVTWATAPAGAATVIASRGSTHAGAWAEWDVTALVNGDGTISLDLTSADANGAYYSSLDGLAAQQPQLVITTGP